MADFKATLQITQHISQYDENAKKLLSYKPILANILVQAVDDFIGMEPREVVNLIEGEPSISSIPVEPGFTNSPTESVSPVITGMNTENKILNEGVCFFDILFYVRTGDGLSKVIVNLEAQKSDPVQYDIELRGIFYAAREISSQLGQEFSGQHYNDIKKVYSIWVCMNCETDSLGHIHLTPRNIFGTPRWKEQYDILHVVLIRLGKELQSSKEHKLHRLLGALFLPQLPLSEKEAIFEQEFDIQLKSSRKELSSLMCNLGEGIYEEGIIEGISKGEKQGISLERNAAIRRMLAVNVTEEQLVTYGYTLEEIHAVKNAEG